MKLALPLLAGLALLSASVVAERAAHAEGPRDGPGEASLPGRFEGTIDPRLRVLERAAEPEKAHEAARAEQVGSAGGEGLNVAHERADASTATTLQRLAAGVKPLFKRTL